MGPELSRAKVFFFFFFFFFFLGADAGFTKCACRFVSPRGRCRIYQMGGGGERRSKHWPRGAGDPRYATVVLSTAGKYNHIQNVLEKIMGCTANWGCMANYTRNYSVPIRSSHRWQKWLCLAEFSVSRGANGGCRQVEPSTSSHWVVHQGAFHVP